MLKQVAEDIGMHESTISRVTANKYMYCPQGMLELKFFFNAGLQRVDQPSDMLSSVTVRDMIKKMVAEGGCQSSPQRRRNRRTIARAPGLDRQTDRAKYRAEENIPPATQRKRFSSPDPGRCCIYQPKEHVDEDHRTTHGCDARTETVYPGRVLNASSATTSHSIVWRLY